MVAAEAVAGTAMVPRLRRRRPPPPLRLTRGGNKCIPHHPRDTHLRLRLHHRRRPHQHRRRQPERQIVGRPC